MFTSHEYSCQQGWAPECLTKQYILIMYYTFTESKCQIFNHGHSHWKPNSKSNTRAIVDQKNNIWLTVSSHNSLNLKHHLVKAIHMVNNAHPIHSLKHVNIEHSLNNFKQRANTWKSGSVLGLFTDWNNGKNWEIHCSLWIFHVTLVMIQ